MKRIVPSLMGVILLAGSAWAVGNDAMPVSAHMAQIESRPGIHTRIVIYRPDRPTGIVILFPDGSGLLDITHVFNVPHLGRSADIPLDLMDHFFEENIAVVLVDAPSDHRSKLGLNGWDGPRIFRLSSDHARDIGAVVAYLKQQDPLPIWLAGIRMGAFSAATAAIHLQQEVAGLVIAGGITRCPKQKILLQLCPEGLMGMPLHEITIPTLILSGGMVPEPLLTSALAHAPSIRFQNFPELGDFATQGGWNTPQTVLPGVANTHVSREVAEFMQWNLKNDPFLVCETLPEPASPLEIYLAGCLY